jgi:hypothetical protein
MSDAIETLKEAKELIVMDMTRSAIAAINTVIEELQSGEPVAYWNKDFTYASFIKLADHIEGNPPSGWVPLYTTPQPVVPEAKVWNQAEGRDGKLYADGWNACRDALLSAGKGGE